MFLIPKDHLVMFILGTHYTILILHAFNDVGSIPHPVYITLKGQTCLSKISCRSKIRTSYILPLLQLLFKLKLY